MPRGHFINIRRGTAAAWTAANPTLLAGEPGFETDTLKFKIGDGATAWNSLAYQGGTGLPQGGPLTEDLDADGFTITNLVDPTADQEAATKKYVDDNAGGSGTTQVAFVEFTSNVDISATVEASGNTVVSAGAVTYENVVHKIEFWAPKAQVFGAGGHITLLINLWDGASNLFRIGEVSHIDSGSGEGGPIYLQRFITPSAASHTYIVKAWVSGTSASAQFKAGNAGSSSTLVPGFIRITKGG